MKYDIITIGSVTQDIYIPSRVFPLLRKSKRTYLGIPYASKTEIPDLHFEVGGGAINAAATFANFNFSVATICRVGDDAAGQFVLHTLKRMGISTSYITVVPGWPTVQSLILLNSKGERTLLVSRGVSASNIGLSAVKKVDAPWMYLSSVGGNMPYVADVFSAHADGKNIAWNPGKKELQNGAPALKKFMKATDVLLLNDEEARILFGTGEPKKLVSRIRSVTSGAVVITSGEHGSKVYVGNKLFLAKIVPVRAKDTTGAGDAFGSGFISGLLRKPGDFTYALVAASANAMSEVLTVGTKHGLVTPQTISKFKKRIRILQETLI